MSYDFSRFIVDHKPQLLTSDVPEYFWHSLYLKLSEDIYDVGTVCELQLNCDETGVECIATKPMKASSPENIYLIDNAWSFEMNKAAAQLREDAKLRDRIAVMVGLDTEGADVELVVDSVLTNIWRYLRYYDITIKNSEERRKIWYILDEVGSFIKHEETNPSVRIVPFIYVPNADCYSIMWLISDINEGHSLSVNRVEHIVDENLRKCISYVWTRKAPEIANEISSEILNSEFFLSHRILESNPDLSIVNLGIRDPIKSPLKVFTDVVFVQKSLTYPAFEITNQREEANILWLFDHFKQFEELSREQPRTLINQFPSETVITTKDLLAELAKGSTWLPRTFNLKTELAQFIRHFCQSEQEFDDRKSLDTSKDDCPCNCHYLNFDCGTCESDKSCRSIRYDVAPVWIVKPWNLARGMGIFISQNLDQILRIVEAYPAEPKIASRYITDPVLFYREDLGINVKFDIRYMVMLISVDPFRAFACKVFWLRFANKAFVLRAWDDYETHFTVMNYRGECQLKNITCEEFVRLFDNQYPKYPWSSVEKRIHSTLRDIMVDATRRSDPFRIRHSPQSRGMYAVDLILEWTRNDDCTEFDIQPQICEVNYCPDCTRACQYHPEFFNDVFRTMFLDDPSNVVEL